jgi:poly(3-hydroxybutyrate) depolymerase
MKHQEPFVMMRGNKKRKLFLAGIMICVAQMIAPVSAQSSAVRPIWFGTTLVADSVTGRAQKLATSLANPSSAKWQAKGDQKRTYRFPDANTDEPYRLCVPAGWDGTSKLPLVMFLHGAGNNESSYLDANNKLMINLASQHGFLLVSPMGDQGAYGNFLRLTAPFGDSVSAANLMSQVTPATERTNQLSEQDVINVLEIVMSEYPIDRNAMFLTGHSMGSGGTWLIGGKYQKYWRAIAPMSGPFVQKSGYPWDRVREMPVLITEGTQAPSLSASRVLRDWMSAQNMKLRYKEVNADHGGMVSMVLPDVLNFFDSCKALPVPVVLQKSKQPVTMGHVRMSSSHNLHLLFTRVLRSGNATVAIYDIKGAKRYTGMAATVAGEAVFHGVHLSSGIYQVQVAIGLTVAYATLSVTR